jgi:hypothetical protein
METTENPYAPPPTVVEPPEDAEALLKAATRMYRGIGWCGVAYVAFVWAAQVVLALPRLESEPVPIALLVMLGDLMWMLFFVFVLRTANRLGQDFDRMYRRARWLGILAAALWFPLLTIPGILAVRRLERYRRFVNDPKHNV